MADADVQVPVGELVGNVKAQWAKLPSLQRNSVEETQREEQRLEVCRLRRGEERNKLVILLDTQKYYYILIKSKGR